MRNWFQAWLGHIFLGLIALDHLWERVKPACEKCAEIGQFIERRISQRRKITMVNFINGIVLAEKDAVILSTFLSKLPSYLPLIQKQIGDAQKAAADRSNPVELMTDVTVLLGDLNSDLSALSALAPILVPSLSTTPPVTPAA